MDIHFLPTTLRGRIGTMLAALALLEFIALYFFAELYNVITTELLITLFGLIGMAAAITGAIMALLAIRKDRERSILTYVTIAFGIVVAGFLLGNLLGIPGI
ncbi:hypothetical protein QMA09_04640 [Planococcus sp. APC 3906]|uniref:hypothetical protein n=1 Tax=Planococcus sp. APC 3906 TaxID=3035194 RepID=UPI0025B4E089|nr:hypothetical protein [Planococcus sp. APC 3906]MDN3449465.1 hypothetical protein [Planococcus sp. APC 3906]